MREWTLWFVTGLLFGMWAGHLAWQLTHPEPYETSLLTKPVGCIGDWVSHGLYCHWIDDQGNHITSRAY